MSSNFYLEDILSQDAELTHVLKCCQDPSVKENLKKLSQIKADKVVFSGMGSSHFCSYGADIMLKQHGMSSQVVSAGELIYYEKDSLNKGTVLCLISQSGESAEIKHLLELLDEEVYVIGVTNQPQSTLAKRSDMTFLLNVSDEISVTTRTYQSSLVIVQLIGAALCKEDTDQILAEYEKTVAAMSEYLKGYQEEARRLTEFCQGMNVVSVMGRGNSLSTVRAGALFLREVAKFPAIDFDSAEFRHGPMEMVQEGFYGIVTAPSGRTRHLAVGLAKDIADKGGRVIFITDQEDAELAGNSNVLPMILPKTEEYASQLLQVIPIQLLANALAEEKGIPAGVFRWGSKITAIE